MLAARTKEARWLYTSGVVIFKGVAAAGAGVAPLIKTSKTFAADPIKVGILHSLTGTIAIAEASVVDAEKLAIEEINAAGGVMGRKVEPVTEDGASDWPTFAGRLRRLTKSARPSRRDADSQSSRAAAMVVDN